MIKKILLPTLLAFPIFGGALSANSLITPLNSYSTQQQDFRSSVEKNTYSLGLKGGCFSLLPLVVTERGVLTAGHCVDELVAQGHKSFLGKNNSGEQREFTYINHYNESRGKDWAILSGDLKGGLKLGSTQNLKVGDKLYMYSPKFGWSDLSVSVIPNTAYDPLKIYVKSNTGFCGASGSAVVDGSGRVVGVFVAMTGDPNSPDGVFLRIEQIFS